MDGHTIKRLFDLYEKKLYAVAFSVLHTPWDAEDAVLDTFEKLIRGSYSIADTHSAQTKALLIRLVQSAAIDIYRKNMRRISEVPIDNVEDLLSDEAMDLHIRMYLEQILDLVDGSEKELLRLRFLEDRNVRETADILHLTEQNVRKRQERAIKKIRKQLKGRAQL